LRHTQTATAQIAVKAGLDQSQEAQIFGLQPPIRFLVLRSSIFKEYLVT